MLGAIKWRWLTLLYDRKLEAGLEFQDHAMKLFYRIGIPLMTFASFKNQVATGENLNGIEIKLDRHFRETGNLYIETAERSSSDGEYWHKSGIWRDDNSWLYAIGDYKTLYLFSIKHLRALEKEYKHVTTPTSQAFLFPLDEASHWSIKELGEEC
jgi:hypothetical protein